jgi:hypothetical protein
MWVDGEDSANGGAGIQRLDVDAASELEHTLAHAGNTDAGLGG